MRFLPRSAYEPEKTADAMHLLYDKEKVFGFIGNVGTPTAAVASIGGGHTTHDGARGGKS